MTYIQVGNHKTNKMKKVLFFLIGSILIQMNCFGQFSLNNNAKRIEKAKEVTVQILIDGIASGTGFFINNKGLVVSNMHVIEAENLKIDTITHSITSKIEIKLNTGKTEEVSVVDSFLKGEGYQFGKFYDFICLEPKSKLLTTKYVKIGDYESLIEGDNIYTCGYPFGIEQPVFTKGIVSTKFKQYSLDSLNQRNVAWLDLSMNKGNSGGPVFVMKDNPENDVVIGIASFNLNVLSQYAKQLKAIARNRGTNAILGGLDIKGFAELTAISIEANSYGIGGLISIEYLKQKLK